MLFVLLSGLAFHAMQLPSRLILLKNSVRGVGAFGIMGGSLIKGDLHETCNDLDVDNRWSVFK